MKKTQSLLNGSGAIQHRQVLLTLLVWRVQPNRSSTVDCGFSDILAVSLMLIVAPCHECGMENWSSDARSCLNKLGVADA